jgi:hypothetical protein
MPIGVWLRFCFEVTAESFALGSVPRVSVPEDCYYRYSTTSPVHTQDGVQRSVTAKAGNYGSRRKMLNPN